MKGKDGMARDCRARGGSAGTGALSRFKGKNTTMAAAEGAHSENEPDDDLGRAKRARGGKAESDDEGEKHNAEEKKRGGRTHKKRGGKIEGEAKKPHMGRAMRARGGKTADLNPMTHDAGMKPKHRYIEPESEEVP